MRGALGMLFSAMMSAGILATSLLGWLVKQQHTHTKQKKWIDNIILSLSLFSFLLFELLLDWI